MMNEIAVFADVPYGPHARQRLDVYRPAAGRRAPLVLLVHGGGWAGGGKDQYIRKGIALAKAGIAAASVGYRLLPEAAWPEIAYDVLRGAAHVKEHAGEFGLDARRAVTWGSSSGAHLALCVQAWRDEWVRAGVVRDAPEIIGTVAQCPVVRFPEPADESLRYRELMNGRPHAEVSPAHIEPRRFRSVLVVQCDADETTPLAHARCFVERLAAAGVDARLEVLAGAEHGFGYDPIFSEHGIAGLRLGIEYVRERFEERA